MTLTTLHDTAEQRRRDATRRATRDMFVSAPAALGDPTAWRAMLDTAARQAYCPPAMLADLWHGLCSLAADLGYFVRVQPWHVPHGVTRPEERRIVVMTPPDAVTDPCLVLAHELAHLLLHFTDDDAPAYEVCEAEADCAAYVVLTAASGVDTHAWPLPDVAGWPHTWRASVAVRATDTAWTILDTLHGEVRS